MGCCEGVRERQPGPVPNYPDSSGQGGKEGEVKPHEKHRANARHVLIFHLVTVSSSRFKMMHSVSGYKDESGDLASRLILEADHKVNARTILPDEKVMIRHAVKDFLKSGA